MLFDGAMKYGALCNTPSGVGVLIEDPGNRVDFISDWRTESIRAPKVARKAFDKFPWKVFKKPDGSQDTRLKNSADNATDTTYRRMVLGDAAGEPHTLTDPDEDLEARSNLKPPRGDW